MEQPEGRRPAVFQHDYELALTESAKVLNGARIALFCCGGIIFIKDVMLMDRNILPSIGWQLQLAADVAILAVFICLGVFFERQRFAVILTGLLLFAAIQLCVAIDNLQDGRAFYAVNFFSGSFDNIRGSLLRLGLFALLGQALPAAYRVETLKRRQAQILNG